MPLNTPSMSHAVADPASFGTTLLTALIDLYGTQALQWHPTTIRMQLEQDLGVTAPPTSLDKLMAAITIVTTDYFTRSLSRFNDLCVSLAGNGSNPGVFVPADAAECAWGITEALLLDPPDNDEPFCDDIRRYITAVLKDEGFVTPPDVLRIAIDADFSEQVRYGFSGDPAMFSAINQVQTEKTDAINQMIVGNLRELVGQLRALPLANGSTDDLLSRLPAFLRAA